MTLKIFITDLLKKSVKVFVHVHYKNNFYIKNSGENVAFLDSNFNKKTQNFPDNVIN